MHLKESSFLYGILPPPKKDLVYGEPAKPHMDGRLAGRGLALKLLALAILSGTEVPITMGKCPTKGRGRHTRPPAH